MFLMSINLMCIQCKKTHKLSTKRCTCGADLKHKSKYRVRVRTSSGWKTKTVLSLSDAKKTKHELLYGPPIKKIDPPKVDVAPDDSKDPTTINGAFLLYIEWAKIHKKSWDMDQSRYKNFIKKPLGAMKLDEVKPFQVQSDILNKMHNKSYAPSSVKQVLILIKRLYNWSREQGIYEGTNHPCKYLKVPKFDNRVTNPVDRDGLKRLENVLDEWSSRYNKMVPLVVQFALYTGRRKGEILALRWKDVDLDNGVVTIRETKNGSIQTFPISNKAMGIIEKATVLKKGRCPFVFPNRHGKGYHRGGGFDKTWRLIRKKAGIPTTRFHDLRHTYASYLASSGKVDIYTLKELLGHSTIEMTQRYAHLINGALRKAANVADEVF